MIKLIDEEELRKKLWAFYKPYTSKPDFLENEMDHNKLDNARNKKGTRK